MAAHEHNQAGALNQGGKKMPSPSFRGWTIAMTENLVIYYHQVIQLKKKKKKDNFLFLSESPWEEQPGPSVCI